MNLVLLLTLAIAPFGQRDKLASPRFGERRAATRVLDTLHPAAIPAIAWLTLDADLDVSEVAARSLQARKAKLDKFNLIVTLMFAERLDPVLMGIMERDCEIWMPSLCEWARGMGLVLDDEITSWEAHKLVKSEWTTHNTNGLVWLFRQRLGLEERWEGDRQWWRLR